MVSNLIAFADMPRSRVARLRRSSAVVSASTVNAPVAAVSRPSSLAGLVSTPLLVAFWNTALMNCCWRLIRSKSPSGRP